MRRTIDLGKDVYALNTVMSFDHVIRVWSDGTVSEPRDVWAPELHDGKVEGSWELMNGYSGQYGYSGPCMQASECIEGHMARDILAAPGWYVAVYETSEDNSDAEWAVAYILAECEGHESTDGPLGDAVYYLCDGTCVNPNRSY